MLKSLILIALSLNMTFAFAKSRFTDADKAKFLEEVKQAVAAHKIENKGKVDLQIMKPEFNEELDAYYKQEKFTREEMVHLKQQYEDFAKSNPENAEEAFNKFVHDKLEEINKTQVQKIHEGGVCNNWSCEDGLKCAPDPKQEDGPKCKKESRECKEDSDCCSGSCTLNTKTKKRSCEDVYRCFKPLAIGQSCMQNPICGEGECLPFNSKTSGIGECEDRGRHCKKNSDCCSNACNGNKCVESYICKDCVKAGKKPDRGQKCCEGLLPNDKNICVPDVPPVVIPQVRMKGLEKSLVAKISELFISSAKADEAYDTVDADHDTYSNFQAKSEANDTITVKNPEFKMDRKSNFETCDIRFRDDFMNYLKKSDLLNLELALLSFDFVLTGDGVSDYWRKSSDDGSSIYSRLKSVATNHVALRKSTNEKIDRTNDKLTCMCLDVKGYKNITDASKKTFFETKCDEYAKYADPSTTFDELEGDASGIKGKRLLVQWTKNLENFNASLAVDNTGIYKGMAEVHNWTSYEAKWNEAENKKYTLFNFNIKNPSGSVAAMGAILGALLAAGVIAILGGFATTSILTTWAAAGIIATSAITGGTGLWLIASLKGAWITKRPEVFDKYIRSYGCGKKETCVEYSRELNQPFNNICNVHTSANACIKNFVVYYQGDEARYIVDPWIPNGVPKSSILRDINDERDYAHKLDDGFTTAKNAMIAKNPGASGGGGKDGGAFVAESYMRELFIDGSILGGYTPKIGTDEKRYILDDKIISDIKEAAKKYAIDQKFFEEGDKDNLQKFADYTFEYHFLWPKTSRLKEISYPTVGLVTYLDIMSNGVSANMAVGAANASKTFGGLNQKYLEDYLNTLQLYRDQAINQDPGKMKLINAEIEKVQSDLDQQKTVNALSNSSMDSMLENLNSGTIGTAAKGAGAKGNVTLTADQSSFLNAIGKLRSTRKEQLKKLDAFNKSMAVSGNADRASRMSAASKKFASNFTRPTSGAIGPRGAGIFGSGGLDGVGLKSNDDSKKSDGKNSGNGSGYVNFGSGSSGSSYGSGSGSRSSSGKGSGDQNADANANANGNGALSNAGDEDARRLQEAIEARDRANKDKYASKEEQTIFEKVTNAYIRNYDKVLTKKKDKDVPEQK
jgi:hypothetical protein